jgi:hypothetical protein
MTPRKGVDFVPFGRGAWEEILPNERSRFALLFRLTMAADYRTGAIEGSEREIAAFLGWPRKTFHKYLLELGDEVEVIPGINRFEKGRIRLVNYKERLGVVVPVVVPTVGTSSGTDSANHYNASTSADDEPTVTEEVQDSVSRSVDRSFAHAPAAKNEPSERLEESGNGRSGRHTTGSRRCRSGEGG